MILKKKQITSEILLKAPFRTETIFCHGARFCFQIQLKFITEQNEKHNNTVDIVCRVSRGRGD